MTWRTITSDCGRVARAQSGWSTVHGDNPRDQAKSCHEARTIACHRSLHGTSEWRQGTKGCRQSNHLSAASHGHKKCEIYGSHSEIAPINVGNTASHDLRSKPFSGCVKCWGRSTRPKPETQRLVCRKVTVKSTSTLGIRGCIPNTTQSRLFDRAVERKATVRGRTSQPSSWMDREQSSSEKCCVVLCNAHLLSYLRKDFVLSW